MPLCHLDNHVLSRGSLLRNSYKPMKTILYRSIVNLFVSGFLLSHIPAAEQGHAQGEPLVYVGTAIYTGEASKRLADPY
jgi:hypothetical protein